MVAFKVRALPLSVHCAGKGELFLQVWLLLSRDARIVYTVFQREILPAASESGGKKVFESRFTKPVFVCTSGRLRPCCSCSATSKCPAGCLTQGDTGLLGMVTACGRYCGGCWCTFSSRTSSCSRCPLQRPLASQEVEERWQWQSLRPLALPFSYAEHQTWSLGPLYSCSPWSSRPQPLGSGGDATPCKVTREERGPLSNSPALRTVAECFSMCRCEMCNRTGSQNRGRGNSANRALPRWEVTTTVGVLVRPERALYSFWALRQVALKSPRVNRGAAGSTRSRVPGTAQKRWWLQGQLSGSTTRDRRAPPARGDQPKNWTGRLFF